MKKWKLVLKLIWISESIYNNISIFLTTQKMCLYSMYSVMYPSHHWKKWVLPLFFNKSFLCLIVECIYRPSKTLTHQTNHKELAATKADCCVASHLQDALEHTKKTKVDSLWACTFCTCMTGNTSLPIHKTLLWLNSILSHFFFLFFSFRALIYTLNGPKGADKGVQCRQYRTHCNN